MLGRTGKCQKERRESSHLILRVDEESNSLGIHAMISRRIFSGKANRCLTKHQAREGKVFSSEQCHHQCGND